MGWEFERRLLILVRSLLLLDKLLFAWLLAAPHLDRSIFLDLVVVRNYDR